MAQRFTRSLCVLFSYLQDLGAGIVIAALIGFLESIAIAKAFGMYCITQLHESFANV